MSKETENKIELAIAEMQAEGAKINPNTVAKRVGISRATIAIRYPKLKIKIDSLKQQQASDKESASDKEIINKQAKRIKDLEGELYKNSHHESINEESENTMIAKLFETYRLYDEVIADNRDLRNRILHNANGTIDKNTGEVLFAPRKKDSN